MLHDRITSPRLCACGCGLLVAPHRQFRQGHNWRVISDRDRFFKYVPALETDRCQEWTGARNKRGYGQFCVSDRSNDRRIQYPAHRYAWILEYGPIPVDLFVCHFCDNPPCVRIDHLWLGTTQENTADKMAKGRESHFGPSFLGETHPTATLTDSQAAEVRQLWDAHWGTQVALGKRFGVAEWVIHDIVHNKSWQHIPLSKRG